MGFPEKASKEADKSSTQTELKNQQNCQVQPGQHSRNQPKVDTTLGGIFFPVKNCRPTG